MASRVVIVGAAGQLGSALVAEFGGAGHDVVGLTRRELDVSDPSAGRTVERLRAEVIVNASAWNDVDGAEADPAGALRVNRDAVARLAAAASSTGALLVHYSTDFVFDGRAAEPYTEESRVRPLNRYGVSKLAGEEAAAGARRRYVLRLASVFGGRPGQGAGGRSTIDRMMDALLDRRPVRAFTDRTVSPSYTADVARATLQIVERHPAYGVYHCVNTGFTTWSALAHEISRHLGLAGEIVGTQSASVTLAAPRPQFCALSNAKLARAGIVLPTWQDALARHIALRTAAAPRPA